MYYCYIEWNIKNEYECLLKKHYSQSFLICVSYFIKAHVKFVNRRVIFNHKEYIVNVLQKNKNK